MLVRCFALTYIYCFVNCMTIKIAVLALQKRQTYAIAPTGQSDLNCGQAPTKLPDLVCFKHFSPNTLFRLLHRQLCLRICSFGTLPVLRVRNLEIRRKPRNVKTSGLVEFQTICWIKVRFRISNCLLDHFFPTWINFLDTNFLHLISRICIFCNWCFCRLCEDCLSTPWGENLEEIPKRLPANHDVSSKILGRLTRNSDNLRWNPEVVLHYGALVRNRSCSQTTWLLSSPLAPLFWSHPSQEWNLFPSYRFPLQLLSAQGASCFKCFLPCASNSIHSWGWMWQQF